MNNTRAPSLLSIIAYARSGSLDRAWRMFEDAGFGVVDDDPAVLSVCGRLLKDRARSAEGAERKRLFVQAADSYARAAEIGGGTYPLVNAATLSLLAGLRDQAEILARGVLQRGEDEEDTPYYRTATRAEALLVIGDLVQAKAEFAAAIARAPQAYEDHASTLRQFALILDELGEDKAWLDPLRPPRSLHFAGHLSLPNATDDLQTKIRETIRQEHIGFGYGALAAGADILIAETLLEAGAVLHVVLPGSREEFCAASVAPFGGEWPARFERVSAAAHTVRNVVVEPGVPATAVQLAAEIAMGSAAMQAGILMTEAVQLLILPHVSGTKQASSGSDRIGATWSASGRRQFVLPAPRLRTLAGDPFTARGMARKRAIGRVLPRLHTLVDNPLGESADPSKILLAALLRIDLSESAGTIDLLETSARALATGPGPLFAPRWTGETVLAAYDNPLSAAEAALSVMRALGEAVRVAGHYGTMRRASDPFGGAPFLAGDASLLPARMIPSTPQGAVLVTEDFAAALCARSSSARLEFVGELPGSEPDDATRLFSLKC